VVVAGSSRSTCWPRCSSWSGSSAPAARGDELLPRCVSKEGNGPALEKLWKVFEVVAGNWRGIARVPRGNLELRPEWDHVTRDAASASTPRGGGRLAQPAGRALHLRSDHVGAGPALRLPDLRQGVPPGLAGGACMVSSEGSCKIWHVYGGPPDLKEVA